MNAVHDHTTPLAVLGDEYWKYKECKPCYNTSRPIHMYMEPFCKMVKIDYRAQLVVFVISPYLPCFTTNCYDILTHG
jgi:hypothetical protein